MSRKHFLLLPALLLLLLAGAWAILRPEGSSFLPFMDDDGARIARQVEIKPINTDNDANVGDGNENSPAGNESGGGILDHITEEEQQRAREAQERAAIEAAHQNSDGTTEQPSPATTAVPPGPDGDTANTNLSPEEQRKLAERERRINQLRAIKRPPNQSLGNRRPGTRRLKQEVGKKSLDEVTPKLLQDRRGLFAQYFAFSRSPIAELLDPAEPTLDQRTPDVTRIDQQVYFESKDDWVDLPFDKRNFMGVWEGFLVIEKEAEYWLYLGADYTGRVVLSGETVLLNDMRDYTEVSTVLTLSEGLHPIRIEYMEGENGSPVDALGACNFMWVPEGKTKPVPVPPKMLMLPEYLWSDIAPIITSLSKYEGEIADEITIYGQNFGTDPRDEDATFVFARVSFGGQYAEILERTDAQLRIRVPIGAVSGKVIVYRREESNPIVMRHYEVLDEEFPSNSVDFTVTTQFGLFASWHNLEGWSNYDFIDESLHEPDVVRLEREFMFETREDLDHPFRNNPLACRWDGELGIPAGWVEDGEMALIRFQTYGRLRVSLGGEVRETEAATGNEFDLTTIDFEWSDPSESIMPLSIDWTSETGPAGVKILKMYSDGELIQHTPDGPVEIYWKTAETLQSHLFFPPFEPPVPPEIISVEPILEEGEQPPVLPFELTSGLPAVSEGQKMRIVAVFSPDYDSEDEQVFQLSVDGKQFGVFPESYEDAGNGRRKITMWGYMPQGVGEGHMSIRQGLVKSEPYYVDILNKGLIAYLYDLPNPGGYTKMPDLEPLTCFQVRRDAHVNFENANTFKLPFPAETFAIEWFGAIIIEEEGDYRFTTRSDDGVFVWLDGNIVVADDNLHYQREKTGDWVHLVPGVYNFRMQFFENNVHEVCVLEWEARTDSEDEASEFLDRQVIAKRYFTWDQHPVLPSKTGTYKRADGSDPE